MIFTIDEIRHYLQRHTDLETAILELTEENIVASIPLTDFESLNFEHTNENLLKYETMIGMTKEKDYQRTLYKKSKGKTGRYWMACSPKWINTHDTSNTSFKITYWVNYGDDETYGSFTVEQIKEWFNNPDIKLYQLGGTRERVCD